MADLSRVREGCGESVWAAGIGANRGTRVFLLAFEFRRLFFTPDSAPSLSTLRKRIDRNGIPGGTVQDGRYYVDLDEFDAAHRLRAAIAARQAQLAKEPLLDGLI